MMTPEDLKRPGCMACEYQPPGSFCVWCHITSLESRLAANGDWRVMCEQVTRQRDEFATQINEWRERAKKAEADAKQMAQAYEETFSLMMERSRAVQAAEASLTECLEMLRGRGDMSAGLIEAAAIREANGEQP